MSIGSILYWNGNKIATIQSLSTPVLPGDIGLAVPPKKFMLKISLYALFAFSASVSAAQDDPHIRTLAASCAACHGTNGVSRGGAPALAGLATPYFVQRMLGYQTQAKSTAVMAQHAKGLTSDEIVQLGKYFAVKPRLPEAPGAFHKVPASIDTGGIKKCSAGNF
jgi:cytochrome subunit of sulfide dehydrogenase